MVIVGFWVKLSDGLTASPEPSLISSVFSKDVADSR